MLDMFWKRFVLRQLCFVSGDVPDDPEEVDGLPVTQLHEQQGQVVQHQQAVQVANRVLH